MFCFIELVTCCNRFGSPVWTSGTPNVEAAHGPSVVDRRLGRCPLWRDARKGQQGLCQSAHMPVAEAVTIIT
jgi:hypothetical protein